jgi:PAS domain S-box-containing protein
MKQQSQNLAGAMPALLEAMDGGAFCVVQQESFLEFTDVSQKFSAITGYPASEIVGRDFRLLFERPNEPGATNRIKETINLRGDLNVNLFCYRKDGTTAWCKLVMVPLTLKDSSNFVGLLFDVSSEKAQEEQLKLRASTYRSMFENSLEGIYQSTPDGTYLQVNPALARMYGYEDPEQLLKNVQDIQQQIYVDSTMRERFKAEIEQHGLVLGLEYQVRRRDGQFIWISESARAVRGENGRISYYEGFIQEITQRKAAEAALRASQQQLLETSRQIGMAEVATGVLHNMGNALNSINVSVGVLSELVRGSKTSDVRRVAALLHTNSEDLGRFVTTDPKGRHLPKYLEQLGEHLHGELQQFQDELTRLRSCLDHVNSILGMQQSYAKTSSMAERVNPIDLVEDALRMSIGASPRRDIEIVKEYAPRLPDVTVSKHAVLQILLNLLRNAQKACDLSGATSKRIVLRVNLGQQARFLKMEVADNGVGIPEADLPRIFGHGFTTRTDGHGFGLHSGALVAKELGGTLAVVSDGAGKGACFTLEFPCICEA